MTRPYVILSCAISMDGYLDRAEPGGLRLSNDADFDRVDQLRADSDAIMVGASTVRRDDPRLCVRSAQRQKARHRQGLERSPVKVTVTASGDLPPDAAFFTSGEAERLVYCPTGAAAGIRKRLGDRAGVVPLGAQVRLGAVLDDLASRGVRRLMVEGGGILLTQLLVDGLADELQLVIAPVFVGESDAPRFVHEGQFPWSGGRRATLTETRRIDDVVLLRYALSERAAPPSPEQAQA